MKRIVIAMIFVLICGCPFLYFYTKAELTVNSPQVITKSIKEKDTPALIKELVGKIKEGVEKDEAGYTAMIKEVEVYADSCDKPDEKAILHSLIAEMYLSFESLNAWKFNQRTPIVGYVPEDINEWTSNLFKEKVAEEFRLSLQPAELLQQIPISKYSGILQSGKDEALRPSLYDYLIYRVLAENPSDELYQELIAYKRKADNQEALMLAELDYLGFKFEKGYSLQENESYLAALDSLHTVYAQSDFAAEIWIKRMQIMDRNPYLQEKEKENAVNKEIIELCNRAVERYPAYKRIGVFKNELATRQNPELLVTLPGVSYPGRQVKLEFRYRNVNTVNIKVYETNLTPELLGVDSYRTKKTDNIYKSNRKLLRQINSRLDLPNTFQKNDTSILCSGQDKNGIYAYEISVPGTKLSSTHFVYVTKLLAVPRVLNSGGGEFLVTDLYTGKPVDKATVYLYTQKNGDAVLADSVVTDSDGLAKVSNKENLRFYRAAHKDDVMTPLSYIYLGRREYRKDESGKTTVSLFTDRGLYRPGQSVYIKGIAYAGEKEERSVVPGRKVSVILRDANHKEISTREFTTNEFGSFNGEFLLPQTGLTGYFTLSAENATASIQVEEYKRPSFGIDIDPVKDEIAFGDQVRIKGKAQTFSGVPLQSGTVNYRVVLRPIRLLYFPSYFNDTQVAFGEAVLNEDGTFSFEFVPEKPKDSFSRTAYVSYEVIASLSDSKGETQETNSFFSVGSSSLILSTKLAEIVKNEDLSVLVEARTLNGEPAKTRGKYFVYELEQERKDEGESIVKTKGVTVAEGEFTTEAPISEEVFSALPSGSYRLRFEAADSKGRPVEFEHDVVLYTDKDKRPPVFSDTWMPETDIFCLPGEEAEFVFGTSHEKAYVLYELMSGDKVFARKRIELSNENKKLTVPFIESYGDGVTALFTFVKEGKLNTRQLLIMKKMPDKKLTVKTETFRDKLMPGDRENWKFKVAGSDSLPVMAEILASMYDASLDRILPFEWGFNPGYHPYVMATMFTFNHSYNKRMEQSLGNIKYITIPAYEYSVFDFRDAMLMGHTYSTRAMSLTAVNKQSVGRLGENMVLAESAAMPEAADQMSYAQDASAGGDAREVKKVPLRKNFNETAFFYPVLRTDKDGVFSVDFTLPESNTTWKLQAIAHTKDMKYGQLTKEIVSSKPLMVLPNLPRFVRQGDEVTISAQIMNRSEEPLSGRVRLELFDPATDEAVLCLTKSDFPFDLAAGAQTTAAWTVPVAAGKDLLGVRVVADAETVSDGEQHLLPILSNEVMVTESVPFYLKGEGEKEIPVPGNERTSYRPFRQTLEFSANPVWYAVQALPVLTRPSDNSASSWFASYYSNVLASSIVKSHPRIKTVIDQWTARGEDASSLISNLEKNEELKNILLEETPWVLEAQDETEQIKRLNTLFDLNRAESQREEALRELIRLQREDGAWGWFSGFGADRYVTISILQGMADLVNLNAVEYGQAEKEMQMNALKYLDEMIRKDYEWLKKNNKTMESAIPSELQLSYIFMRSSYRDIPEAHETREAIRFYTDRAEKNWEKLSIRMKAQTALLMQRNGKKEKASVIMNWFKRTATQTEEQGIYWANNRRTGFSPVSPVETHTLLMSAFSEIKTDGMDVDLMKQWLLNQKRTQYWETAPATLNAIYTLLLTGSDWLDEDNRVVVKWGNETIDSSGGTAGIGYSKTSRSEDKIASGEKITIRKTGTTPAWGALYSQYFVPADMVEKHQGDLSIEKKLFVEKTSGEGVQLVALQEGETLRVGDKAVVRLTIRTKQEMTYVHLKDLRAGCFEPADQLSGTHHRDGVSFYKAARDISEHFYFDRLPEGTFVLEYGVYVSRKGEYASGPADIQCLYAPEFTSHTEGGRLIIKD